MLQLCLWLTLIKNELKNFQNDSVYSYVNCISKAQFRRRACAVPN